MQCQTESGRATPPAIRIPPIQLAPPPSPVGTWEYQNSPWYSEKLTLQADGTFAFHSYSCTGQLYSRGYWTGTTGVVRLTSFTAFRPKARAADAAVPVVRAAFSLPQATDSTSVYLANTLLRLQADTLVCTHSAALTAGTKFYRAGASR